MLSLRRFSLGGGMPQNWRLVKALQKADPPSQNARPVRIFLGKWFAKVGTGGIVLFVFAPEWRNWQTRCVQVAVTARSWGFKSLLRYQFTTVKPNFC